MIITRIIYISTQKNNTKHYFKLTGEFKFENKDYLISFFNDIKMIYERQGYSDIKCTSTDGSF